MSATGAENPVRPSDLAARPADPEALRAAGWRVVRRRRTLDALSLGSLWSHRDVILYLTRRDIRVRYKQAFLGVAWVVLAPLLQALVLAFVFGRLAGLREGVEIPYELYVFSGLIAWQAFGQGLARVASSLVASQDLLKKVAFPRLIAPLTAVLPVAVDALIGLAVVVTLGVVVHGIVPRWTVVLVPLFYAGAMFAAFSVGLWFAVVNAWFRDAQQVVPFMIQVGMYLTPVAYGAALVPPGPLRIIYELNPMLFVCEGVRWCMFEGMPTPPLRSAAAFAFLLLVLAGGLAFFRRHESTLADVL